MENEDDGTSKKLQVVNVLDATMQDTIIRGHVAKAVSKISSGVTVMKAVIDSSNAWLDTFEESITAFAIKNKGFIDGTKIRVGSNTVFKFLRAACEKQSPDKK